MTLNGNFGEALLSLVQEFVQAHCRPSVLYGATITQLSVEAGHRAPRVPLYTYKIGELTHTSTDPIWCAAIGDLKGYGHTPTHAMTDLDNVYYQPRPR